MSKLKLGLELTQITVRYILFVSLLYADLVVTAAVILIPIAIIILCGMVM